MTLARFKRQRPRLRYFLLCLCFTNLAFYRSWSEVLFSPGAAELFFIKNPPNSIDRVAVCCVVLLTTLLLWAFVLAFKRFTPAWAQPVVRTVILVLVPVWIVVQVWTKHVPIRLTQVLLFVLEYKLWSVLAALVVIPLLVLAVRHFDRLSRIGLALLLASLPFTFITFGQSAIGIFNLLTSPPAPPAAVKALPPPSHRTPRVVVVIFDELDFGLTFGESRYRVEMPTFRKLASQSLFAERAYAPSNGTQRSVPAMLHGDFVIRFDVDASGQALVGLRGMNGQMTPLAPLPSVVTDTTERGLNVAMMGWYLPYPRLFKGPRVDADWESFVYAEFNRTGSQPKSLGERIQRILWCASPLGRRVIHWDTLNALLEKADRAFDRPGFSLVWLHLPVPHGPYMFNRFTGERDLFALPVFGYLDNLALADRSLDTLLRSLADSPEADRTWLIVTSDHPLRPEIAMKLKNRLGRRVPCMIRAPGQTEALKYRSEFNTVLFRKMIGDILGGSIKDAPQLAQWLDTHRTIGESPYQMVY